MKVLRQKLTQEQLTPPGVRWNEDCNCVQRSPDGGVTWVDDPTFDPRHGDSYRFPPLGSGERCRAAAGMVEFTRQWVTARLSVNTAIGLAGAILGVVSFIPGFGQLWALIMAIAGLALTLSQLAIDAAFTEATYDDLLCIFYCNIDDNGQMSVEQLSDVYAQIDADLPAIAVLWMHIVLDAMGEVGMSDAGVQYAEAADCDECLCNDGWCFEYDFRDSAHGFTGIFGGTWVDGVGWTGGGADSVYIQKTFGFDVPAFEVTAYIGDAGVLSAPSTSRRICANDTGATCPSNNAFLDPVEGAWFAINGFDTLHSISLGCERSDSDTSPLTNIWKLRFTSPIGDSPFGVENCVDE